MPWSRGRRRVVLVFDGPTDENLATSYGRLLIRFSGSRSADSLIREVVSKGSSWTVVTDDLGLRNSCRRRGAKHLGVRAFLAQIPRESLGELGEEQDPAVDLGEWEEFFRRGSAPGVDD